jgi:hypothetical protein
MEVLKVHSRVVREAAEGSTDPLTLDLVFPTEELRALHGLSLTHALERVGWEETPILDAYLPLDETRAAWLAKVDVTAVVRTVHYLDFDDAYMRALSGDILRSANTVEEMEGKVRTVRACELTTALVDATFVRMCLAFPRVVTTCRQAYYPTLPLPETWGKVPFTALFRAAAGLPFFSAPSDIGDVAVFAAAFGRVNVLRQLRTFGYNCGSRAAAAAARGGHLATLQWARSVKARWTAEACDMAALGGHMACLEYLHAQGCPCEYAGVGISAGAGGHLPILEWAWAHGCRSSTVGWFAAQGGHLHILQWLQERGALVMCTKLASSAASLGHLEMLQWLSAQGCPWDEESCAAAAKGGHLTVLQWLRAQDCPWNENTCEGAAGEGHLEVLQWARANGCPWDQWVCTMAAGNGHLAVLQWAHEHGCPWDSLTCTSAAEYGCLEVLQWAHAHGCPWDQWTADGALRQGHVEVFRWLHAHGCPLSVHDGGWGLSERARQALREIES